mgnify:CR=1 FL=1
MTDHFKSESIDIQCLPSTITPEVFNQLLLVATEHGASDVVFRSSTQVRARVSGEFQRISDAELEKEEIMSFIQYCQTEQTAISLSSGAPKSFAYNLLHPKGSQRFRFSASSVNDKRSEYGVRLVCRPIQDRPLPLSVLGLPKDLEEALATPNNKGIILITGETGSGKTTLLASVIDKKASMSGINIATLEDPIEFNLTYLNDETESIVAQAALGTHLGSFAVGLRGLLRDNPDVILVGEMRDEETIKLGVEASRTGHLVYSTLHVTNVSAIIDRMCMPFKGGEQIQMASSLIDSLRCGVNQELLPKVCQFCSVPITQKHPMLESTDVDLTNAKHPVGCDKCKGKGFSGRHPIIEYLVLTNNVRTELKRLLITDGLGGVGIRLQELVEEFGQTKYMAAKKAFEAGMIAEEMFVAIFQEYQTLEYLQNAAKNR